MDDPKNILKTKTYSVTLNHIEMVREMSQQFHVNQSNVVRQAIERLYSDVQSGNVTLTDAAEVD